MGPSKSNIESTVACIDLTGENETPKSREERPLLSKVAKDKFYNRNIFITFSLVDSENFTAICAHCPSMDRLKEIMHTYQHVPKSRFDWASSPPRWVFPVNYHDQLLAIMEKLHDVKIEPLPQRLLRDFRTEASSLSHAANTKNPETYEVLPLITEAVYKQLAPFQVSGVEFVLRGGGRSLIADDMGLGKTRTAIAAAMAYQADWPVLVVTPSSARHHWYEEIKKVLVQTGVMEESSLLVVETASQALYIPKARKQEKKIPSFIIMSYSLVQKMEAKLRTVGFNVVICDECHYLKNAKAGRTKTLVPLLKESRRALMISGTPALSRPIELFTQLNALDPVAWPDERAFGRRYCSSSSGSGGTGDLFRGARNCRELHTVLTSKTGLMIRRLKTDVLLQLPHKTRHVVYVGILDEKKRAECTEMCASIGGGKGTTGSFGPSRKKRCNNEMVDAEGGNANAQELGVSQVKVENFSALLQLFSRSGLAKVDAVLQKIGQHLDDPNNGKLLVFAHHTPVMDAIEAYISSRGVELIRIDGQTQSVDRFANTRHFQSAPSCRVALLAITAAGIGITLTAASTVFFVEMFWTPGSLIQAEDRAHRLGQTRAVSVTYFLAKGTIDDILWPLLCRKVRTLGDIVEAGGGTAFEVHSEQVEDEGASSQRKRKASVSEAVTIKEEIVDEEDLTLDNTMNMLAIQDLTGSPAAAGASAEVDDDMVLDTDDEEFAHPSRAKSRRAKGKALKGSKGKKGSSKRGEEPEEEETAVEDLRVVTDQNESNPSQLEAEEIGSDVVASLYAKWYGEDGKAISGGDYDASSAPVDLTAEGPMERIRSQFHNYSHLLEVASSFILGNLEASEQGKWKDQRKRK